MLFNIRSVNSLLKSTLTVEEYITNAKNHGYSSIGLADDQVMHGALQFYSQAKANGVKPLLGLKVSLLGLKRHDKTFPFLIYAINSTGYKHLMKISRLTERTEQNEHQIWQYLRTISNDLVYISLGRESEIEQAIIYDDIALAEETLTELKEVFGENNVYMGLSIYPVNATELNLLNNFAQTFAIPQIIVQLVNSLHENEAFSLKILEAINNNETIEPALQSIRSSSYLMPQDYLFSLYTEAGLPQIINSTKELANRLNVELDTSANYLPRFQTPDQSSSADYLEEITTIRLKTIGKYDNEVYKERLEYELKVINQMGFSDYFLIVWEIISYCHERKIRVGPGRGSAAGSLVSYLLQITLVDPIEYDLLFERFLNPERYNMPDIDIDIPDDKRQQVLKFIQQNYGYEQVAQIVTMGTFGAKQAVRDTLRVLGAGSEELRRWSRSIPSDQNQAMTLERAYKLSEPLRKIISENKQNQAYFRAALTIEGIYRHTSTHAAAVVINDTPIDDIIPVKDRENDLLITQFTMNDVEQSGLLKMDFLGLRNLTILDNILNNIARNKDTVIDINQLPMNDSRTIEIFRRADTNGIFQFESDGIKNVLQKLQPESFEDIVAVNALYRPGPMKQIDSFIHRKHGKEKITYLNPILEPILRNTYGIIVYQEQVMQIVVQMAGFTLGEADILRRAMGKKQADVMEQERKHFVEGALNKGFDRSAAEEVYQYIYEFSNYGFNRAHAVVYSTLAYQLAYLKAHYPVEFYQAILNNGRSQTTSFNLYVQEAKNRLGQLKPLDINLSQSTFSADDHLRIGFSSVKGIRKELVEHILNDRGALGPYKDFLNFIHRLPHKYRKKEMLETLIMAGAFDSFGYNRATLVHNLPAMLQSVEYSGQSLSLFQEIEPKIEWKEEFSIFERLNQEKSVLGFTVSGHPLSAYTNYYQQHPEFKPLNHIRYAKNKQNFNTIALINESKVIRTKNNDLMAFLTVSDELNELTVVVFPNLYQRAANLLKENFIIAIKGKIDYKGQTVQIIADNITLPEKLSENDKQIQTYQRCFIQVQDFQQQNHLIERLKDIALNNPGPCTIILVNQTKQSFKLDDIYNVSYSIRVQQTLKNLFGEKQVVYR